jgi:hypothetical protein
MIWVFLIVQAIISASLNYIYDYSKFIIFARKLGDITARKLFDDITNERDAWVLFLVFVVPVICYVFTLCWPVTIPVIIFIILLRLIKNVVNCKTFNYTSNDKLDHIASINKKFKDLFERGSKC